LRIDPKRYNSLIRERNPKQQSGPLRLQSPRSAFADTPTRRYADTALWVVAPLRYGIRGLLFIFSADATEMMPGACSRAGMPERQVHNEVPGLLLPSEAEGLRGSCRLGPRSLPETIVADPG
jgi:hypothetical protein